MTIEELLQLFDNFTDSCFRLETLQHYAVPGDEDRQRAFHEGRPLPPPRPEKQETLTWTAESVQTGKRIYRVHVIEFPLTPHVRYELHDYGDNAAAGEEVFIANRATHPDLDQLRDDFYLFDAETDHAVAVWYRYASDGRLTEYVPADDAATIQRCRRLRDLTLAHAVPLTEFLANSLRS